MRDFRLSRRARAVLFSKCLVNSYCVVEGAVLLPEVEVGRHARLRNVVVDRGCRIPDGLVIGEDAVADAANFFRTEQGVTLVTRGKAGAPGRSTRLRRSRVSRTRCDDESCCILNGSR